eukprot:TRINITY_DN5545_c0_g1_i5.p3 TRINITY_DN5545_c0_g1~~TRINITY_DN5545_c0_g1_i5.p3  ORF type:complete len:263 (-),score=39.67 TRINITY_DN5545_c0_g1_i5:136-924(-)
MQEMQDMFQSQQENTDDDELEFLDMVQEQEQELYEKQLLEQSGSIQDGIQDQLDSTKNDIDENSMGLLMRIWQQQQKLHNMVDTTNENLNDGEVQLQLVIDEALSVAQERIQFFIENKRLLESGQQEIIKKLEINLQTQELPVRMQEGSSSVYILLCNEKPIDGSIFVNAYKQQCSLYVGETRSLKKRLKQHSKKFNIVTVWIFNLQTDDKSLAMDIETTIQRYYRTKKYAQLTVKDSRNKNLAVKDSKKKKKREKKQDENL